MVIESEQRLPLEDGDGLTMIDCDIMEMPCVLSEVTSRPGLPGNEGFPEIRGFQF